MFKSDKRSYSISGDKLISKEENVENGTATFSVDKNTLTIVVIAKFQNIVYDANYTLQIPDGGYVFSQN